jgi:hypothetical protein
MNVKVNPGDDTCVWICYIYCAICCGNVYSYTVTTREKKTVKKFSDEIVHVLGNLVITRLFCVIYDQRRFLNKHLRHFQHVQHVLFIPTLVSKSCVPRIWHVLDISSSTDFDPCFTQCVFLFIQLTYGRKYIQWMQICFKWN